jgi:hypothetical protein
MKAKKPKYIYGLVCRGHYSVNELYQTRRRAEKEAKGGYHKNCDVQVVAIGVY